MSSSLLAMNTPSRFSVCVACGLEASVGVFDGVAELVSLLGMGLGEEVALLLVGVGEGLFDFAVGDGLFDLGVGDASFLPRTSVL